VASVSDICEQPNREPTLVDPVAALLRQPDAEPDASWEFVCECERPDCTERVVLSFAEFETARQRRDLVLAPGHEESRTARARRIARALVSDSQALHAEAALHLKRSITNAARRRR
jgi:hypothetical protein